MEPKTAKTAPAAVGLEIIKICQKHLCEQANTLRRLTTLNNAVSREYLADKAFISTRLPKMTGVFGDAAT